MGKRLNKQFSKDELQMMNKSMKKMFYLSHQGSANQNYIKSLSHPSQNSYHQEIKQQMPVRRKKPSYTVGI
jgi:hypothetical protein